MTPPRRRRRVPQVFAPPPVPDAIEVDRFTRNGEDFALLCWPVARDGPRPADLTAAEADVLARLLDGLSNAQIAAERGTSARTVANQVAKLLRIFGVSSRVELATLVARSALAK